MSDSVSNNDVSSERHENNNHMPMVPAMRPPMPPHHPLPPHERKRSFNYKMDEKDIEILTDVFRDEDTVSAAVEIIHTAPPEIQVLAIQLIKMIEVTGHAGE